MFKKILSGLVFVLSLLTLFFRSKAHKAEAEKQEQRADMAEAAVDTMQDANQAINDVGKRYHKKRKYDEASLEQGARDHFDNNG